MTDRNVLARLPQIALHQLPRPIDRPLETSSASRTAGGLRGRSRRRSTCRPDSQARSRAPAAAATGFVGLGLSCSQIQSLNGSSFDPAGARSYLGGVRRRQRPADRLSMQPRPLADLPNRQPLDPVQPPDLRPLLHADHTPSSSPDPADQTRVKTRPDNNTDPAPGGSLFDRRRWVSIQSAPTVASRRGGPAPERGRRDETRRQPQSPRGACQPATGSWS